jgi:hypothetical protein
MEVNDFCCDIFTELLNAAGSKGFSIIPIFFQNDYNFILQSRSKDYNEKEKKGFSVIQRSIGYCPWCGCNLTEIVSRKRSGIAELAKKNRYLFTELF